jgi:tRNA dimethylallyltransferase
MTPEVLVIAGPTASGKTELSIHVAQALGGEIISADSRQIYRYMDIGTAKPTVEEQAVVPHHLLDVVDPNETFSAGQFALAASNHIEDLIGRGLVPIVVGGAGFYFEALFEGLSPIPETPYHIKSEVAALIKQNLEGAHSSLKDVDPEVADRVAPTDRHRIARALEVFRSTGKPLSHFQTLPRVPATTRTPLAFGIGLQRQELRNRINLRVHRMIEDGLIIETERLLSKGYGKADAMKSFGYRESAAFLFGNMTIEDAVDAIKTGTRQYAKRQITWFRNRTQLNWLDPERDDLKGAIISRYEAVKSASA